MRVTENTNFDTVRNSIRKSKEKMENLQMQNATLRKLNTPSDDPVGASKVLEIRTEKVNNDQFQSNTKMTEMFLQTTDYALGELADIAARAKEIALSQSSGASSTEDTRGAIAEEVTQLFQQAVATANRRIGERYVFGGFKTQKPPVDHDGRYQGDEGQIMVEIARGAFLSMNVPGYEAFNTSPGQSSDKNSIMTAAGRSLASEEKDPEVSDQSGPENVNLFDEIQHLRIGLLTGDLDAIRGTLERLDEMHSKLISMRAQVGSRMQGLQTTSQAMERHNLSNAQLSSVLEDADMAQVVSDMAKEETVFRSALASAHKLIQPTLMDFLK